MVRVTDPVPRPGTLSSVEHAAQLGEWENTPSKLKGELAPIVDSKTVNVCESFEIGLIFSRRN